MKTVITVVLVFAGYLAMAQAPQKFSYQGVARDNASNILANQNIGLQISLHSASPSGTVVYQETQAPTTNAFGLFNIQVGGGTVVSGDLASVDWGANSYYLQVEMDASGGTSYLDMGTAQLLSVPYALYAENSGTPGPQGPAGADGTNGSDGATGAQGPTGPQGQAGADGAIGPQGPTGADGTNGVDGATGPTGPLVAGLNKQTLRHDGSNWVASGALSNDGTNVGIGTTSAAEKLHLVDGKFLISQENTAIAGLEFSATGNGGSTSRIFMREDNNDDFGFSVGFNGGSDNEILNWPENSFNISRHNNDTTGQVVLSIPRNSGNVGLGVTNPTELLHVNGSIRMVDGNQQAGYVPVSDANGKMIWTNPSSITTTVQTNISDADNDTKIQVEKNADEDIIRFDLGGTEQLKISNNANGAPLFEVNSVGGNLYIGKSSGNVDTGTLNTFIGQYAGDVHASGNLNTFLGSDAGRNHSGGGDNIFLGARAGWFNSNGSGNVFIGKSAGYYELGSNKLYIENTSSADPLIYGEFDNDIVGINGKLGVGTEAPTDELHVEGAIRMVDGNQAAGFIPVSDADGKMVWTDPTGISGSLDEIVDADNDTKIEVEATADEDTIRFTIAGTEHFKMSAGRLEVLNTGESVFLGERAGASDDFIYNGGIYIGYEAGLSNVVGASNVYVGKYAGKNSTGAGNVMVGGHAGELNTKFGNLLLGNRAGQNNVNGEWNVIVGSYAGQNSTGSSNIFIGKSAGTSTTDSDRLYIENSNSTTPLIYGEFDNDLVRVNGSFEAIDNFANEGQFLATVQNTGNGVYSNGLLIQAGQNTQSVNNRFISFVRPNGTEIGAVRQVTSSSVDYFSTSDERLKTNINPTTKGLNDLMQIEVKDYVYKEDLDKPQTGFIAQQVFDIYPNAVSVGGDDAKTDPWMMDYGKMTPLLVKAVQDLTKLVEEQQEANKELTQEVQLLKEQLKNK